MTPEPAPLDPDRALQRPDPAAFPALPADRLSLWSHFCDWDVPYFPSFVGLQVEELRLGYARLRLPYRPALDQPAGVVHGGAIATLIDTVVVPAIGAAYPAVPLMLTLSMTIDFLGAVRGEDAIAEGWITRRGGSVVFCEALVCTAGGEAAARGTLVYKVRAADR